MFRKLKKYWMSLRYYVVLDGWDNSVTLSKQLFYHMMRKAKKSDKACVFVFRIPQERTFGFTVNPTLEQPTQLCDIQYNERFRCVGFETLCPSVGSMLYEYGLQAADRVTLSVSILQSKTGMVYYQIERPDGERTGKHT